MTDVVTGGEVLVLIQESNSTDTRMKKWYKKILSHDRDYSKCWITCPAPDPGSRTNKLQKVANKCGLTAFMFLVNPTQFIDPLFIQCILNGSVRGRVSSSRKRFWTLPNLYSEVSALSDSQGYSSSEPV